MLRANPPHPPTGTFPLGEKEVRGSGLFPYENSPSGISDGLLSFRISKLSGRP